MKTFRQSDMNWDEVVRQEGDATTRLSTAEVQGVGGGLIYPLPDPLPPLPTPKPYPICWFWPIWPCPPEPGPIVIL